MANIGELRHKFLRAYANLPEPEKEQVIIIIDDRTYSWDTVNNEVAHSTELGDKLLKRMEMLEIL